MMKIWSNVIESWIASSRTMSTPSPEPDSHELDDPIPNPEPASPSLDEPDPGVFHHEPVKRPSSEPPACAP